MGRAVMALLGFLYSATLWLLLGRGADPWATLLLVASVLPLHEFLHVAAARALGVELRPVVDDSFVGFRLGRSRGVKRRYIIAVAAAPQLLTLCALLLWLSTAGSEFLILALTNTAISFRDIAVLGKVAYLSLRAMSLSTSAVSSS